MQKYSMQKKLNKRHLVSISPFTRGDTGGGGEQALNLIQGPRGIRKVNAEIGK